MWQRSKLAIFMTGFSKQLHKKYIFKGCFRKRCVAAIASTHVCSDSATRKCSDLPWVPRCLSDYFPVELLLFRSLYIYSENFPLNRVFNVDFKKRNNFSEKLLLKKLQCYEFIFTIILKEYNLLYVSCLC